MSGVWLFDNGKITLNSGQNKNRRKILVHVPSNEVISSYDILEHKLLPLGWERYPSADPALRHFHQRSSVHLISVPKDFSKFGTVHMYDIVVKSRNIFEVRDA